MEAAVLRTARLVLDAPRAEDAAAVHAAAQDPLLQRFLTLPETFRLSDARMVVESADDSWRRDRSYAFAVREHGALVGMVTLAPHDWSVGYWLAPEGRGRGLTAEALGAVLDWHAAERPSTPVRWECIVGNLPSLGVARAVGFRYLGTGPASIRRRDGEHPESWLAVLDEWPRREHRGWPV